MPGLLEYLYGNATSRWGAQRIADGHAAPYSTKIVFICSNEEPQQHCSGKPPWPPLAPGEKDFQCYISAFTKWAAATKGAAIELGVWPLTVGVALDSGAGRFFSPGSEDRYRGGASEMIKAIVQADLGPVLWDQHGDGGVAAGWGDGRDWQALLSNVPPSSQSMEALTKAAGKWVKTIMLEENGGGCGLSRALGHVSNSLSFQRFGHQMVAQSAAGMMWSGPQGAKNGDYQIKWLADRIVKAPYWYSQQMLSESHQPNVVGGFHRLFNDSSSSQITGGRKTFVDWMAAVSDDGRTLVIRTENPNAAPVAFKATLSGGPWGARAAVRTLAASSLDAVNDYDTPTAVAPANSTAAVVGSVLAAALPPFSFVTLTLTKA